MCPSPHWLYIPHPLLSESKVVSIKVAAVSGGYTQSGSCRKSLIKGPLAKVWAGGDTGDTGRNGAA